MVRFAMALVVAAAACGGKAKDTANAGSGSGTALYAKKLAVSWGISPNGAAKQDVFLQTTDETGQQQSFPLGTYDGTCQDITPAPEMKAATAVSCASNGEGVELDAVVQGEEIIVLRGTTKGGAAPDPMSRVEVTRVKAPGGAAVQVGA